jgi:DNA repair exonuclease SbcCD ATPase subunit
VTLAEQVRVARSLVDREAGEARALAKAGKSAQARVAVLQEQIELHDRVLGLLTKVGEERQTHAQEAVEGLVTRGLQTIFDESLTFHVVQSIRAGQAQVEFVIRSAHGDQVVETPVMDARGGGMAAVVGLLLRLVVLLLTPGARRVLFLDETFGMVSREYETRVAEFLREVCDKAAVQVILVTHSDAFDDFADARYRLSLGVDGATVVSNA